MYYIYALLFSFVFLTRFPLPFKIDYTSSQMNLSVRFFPFIGVLAGFINIGIYFPIRNLFSVNLAILIMLSFQYYFFNLFHFDGFLDFFEGILSQKTEKSEIFKIMKDPRIGSIGLFIGFVYLAMKFFLIRQALLYSPINLFFYPIAGKLSLVYIMNFLKPARKEGLGYIFRGISKYTYIYATLFSLVFLFFNIKIVFIFIVSVILSSFLIGYIAYKKIDGFTGDVLGAGCEIGELLFLLFLNIKFVV